MDTEELWDWFAVALFLLVSVDLLTTLGATAVYGPAAEANPFVRRLLAVGPLALAVVNLVGVGIAVVSFSGVVQVLEQTPSPYDRVLSRVTELWLGGLIAVGLFLFANNLSVIVHGSSLL